MARDEICDDSLPLPEGKVGELCEPGWGGSSGSERDEVCDDGSGCVPRLCPHPIPAFPSGRGRGAS